MNVTFAGNPMFPFNGFTGMPMNPIPPPPMPVFAFQPPPAIPPNLDQLSDEELRTLEGNERRNVEERIKVCFILLKQSVRTEMRNLNIFTFPFQLLKNIQLMMDASINLMNQYVMISAQFPPITTVPAPNATKENAQPSISPKSDGATADDKGKLNCLVTKMSESLDKGPSSVQQLSKDDEEAGPSTSPKNRSAETLEIDGNLVTIEDLGHSDPDDTSEEMTEIRRRRLQKFQMKSENS